MSGSNTHRLRAVQRANDTLPSPNAPREVAREFAHTCFKRGDVPTLRYWRGGWWLWEGPKWIEVEQKEMDEAAYRFTETAEYESGDELRPWAPNRRKIGDLLHALAALTHTRETISMPCWLDGADYGGLVVSVANGLLDVGARERLEHDPRFFNSLTPRRSRSITTSTRRSRCSGIGF